MGIKIKLRRRIKGWPDVYIRSLCAECPGHEQTLEIPRSLFDNSVSNNNNNDDDDSDDDNNNSDNDSDDIDDETTTTTATTPQ